MTISMNIQQRRRMDIGISLALIVISLIFGVIGIAIAESKGRPEAEGSVRACLLTLSGRIPEPALPKRGRRLGGD